MSIVLNVTANDPLDLFRQLRALAAGITPDTLRIAAEAGEAQAGEVQTDEANTVLEPVKPPVKRGTRAGKGNAAPATGVFDEPQGAEAPAAPPPVDPGKQRAEAVALLRSVYAKGKPGEDAVAGVCELFGVSKLVDVPLPKAGELLKAAQDAHVKVVGPLPA